MNGNRTTLILSTFTSEINNNRNLLIYEHYLLKIVLNVEKKEYYCTIFYTNLLDEHLLYY